MSVRNARPAGRLKQVIQDELDLEEPSPAEIKEQAAEAELDARFEADYWASVDLEDWWNPSWDEDHFEYKDW